MNTEQRQFVEQTLGDSIICSRCHCTLDTYGDRCNAPLDEACPGFLRVEGVLAIHDAPRATKP